MQNCKINSSYFSTGFTTSESVAMNSCTGEVVSAVEITDYSGLFLLFVAVLLISAFIKIVRKMP